MLKPLSVIRTGTNSGGWKHSLEAIFDSKPSEEDIDGASKEARYHPYSYILGNKNVTEMDEGKFKATWTAILD